MATEIGTVIDDKYEILKQIGQGGMSIVYLAMDKRLNKQWAVKEIKKQANGKNDEVIISSLLAEANLMKRLDHPALPRIVDIIDNWQTIYVVMDYIEGESLDKILKEYGPQPQDVVIEWAKQLCDALNYLHSQKPPIIYRDMKPANIMLKPEGNLKVIDFGIAREYKEKNLADTTVLGTRGYAPPEQHGSRQTDARSDVFALGMTMHHLLTGADPRPADYMYAPIRQWNPELSGGLERIIDKCTALNPDDRYQSCNELMYALEHYEEEDSVYKKMQKGKLTKFLISAGLSVVMAFSGIGGQLLSSYENNKNYDLKINIPTSAPYEEKVQNYMEAIDLFGTDTRAYLKLLQAYKDNNLFGPKEGQEFIAKFRLNKDDFDKDSEEYLNLLYEIGVTYFYLYTEEDKENPFCERALKSREYFEEIVNSGHTEFEYYEMAQSYFIVGEFYHKYITNATSVKEPTKEVYDQLISSMRLCIENTDSYEGDDSQYIRLTMYREIANLLNDRRKGFATTKVGKNSVMGLLQEVNEKTLQVSVTQPKSVDLQNSILEQHSKYVENIERAYTNTEERREANGSGL